MSVESAIVARLRADSGVTALVSTRVWQLILPQSAVLPAIRVQLIDELPSAHLRGINGLKPARIQIDAFGRRSNETAPYAEVDAIANAVMAALTPEPFDSSDSPPNRIVALPVDRRPIFDPDEVNTVRMVQDFQVWSRPS